MKALPFLFILLLALPPLARGEEQYAIRRAVEAGQLKPLNEILTRIQSSHPGKVLDVDLERDINGNRIYEITILKNDGQRAKLLVDAVSGSELRHASTAANPRINMAKALRNLLARHPGNVLELELKQAADQRMIYEVQVILLDGRLREFVIDANSGELIDGNGHRQEVLKNLKPLPDILERLPARYRGVIHEVELEYDQYGRYFYEVEVRLADGRVFELDIDAISGKVLNGEEVER
ncbi:putative membrane protein YkoI [Azonexus fungiphilus]|uniref:Putative membrane protein YkoI n=1 Tax=Azonexus fungiphilus TaxID=146940 RepID=A0A495WBM6_9RHOO|nr:PepSY domain-containing protein [Azonexus fungiphilus]RKT58574.1 putative membrane protein YkoI [Azonexus fungiphilus]